MKKQILVMIFVLCLAASSAFAQVGTKHFDEITLQPTSLNQNFPVCQVGDVLTYNGTDFSCTHTIKITGCPVGQALYSESTTGAVSCINMTCPPGPDGTAQVLTYTNAAGAAPTCIPIPNCPATMPGTVLTASGAGYSCTTQVTIQGCPANEAFNGEDALTGAPICINLTCPTGQTLDWIAGNPAPSCFVPPQCAAGTVLTVTSSSASGTTYACTSAITMTCPSGQALSSESPGGVTSCLDISCPTGEALSYSNGGGAPQCINPPPACPTGQVLTVTGMNASGAIYACTSSVTIAPCPAGQALSAENGSGTETCINLTCPAGETLNTPVAGGPPSCIIPPTCGPGFVLTNVGTTYSCTSDVQTIACPANEALVSINSGGIPTCLPVPIAGSCPAGQAIGSISNSSIPVCVSIPGSGTCGTGNVVDIINPNGAPPHCTPAATATPPCPAGYVLNTTPGVAQGAVNCILAATAFDCGAGMVMNTIGQAGTGTANCVTPSPIFACPSGEYLSGINGMNGAPICSAPLDCP